jgi:flavin reductase (DIM6/NTAB) family NADH-FMN oxidoreductase RutF
MSTNISFPSFCQETLEQLKSGAFLTTAYNGKVNSMTIAWGQLGLIWGLPIFTVMVRPSRFSYQLLEQSHQFTVSIPLNDMSQALTLCGSQSGRDMDKIAAAKLTLLPGKEVAVPVIKGCGLHYECKVLYSQPLKLATSQSKVNGMFYSSGDYHTFYYGEIVANYTD